MPCIKCGAAVGGYIPVCNECADYAPGYPDRLDCLIEDCKENERKREMDNHILRMKALDEATATAQENGEYDMSHPENDKLIDAVDDGTINPDDERVSELLDDKAASEEYKMKQLYTFFKWGLNCERIEECDDGGFIPDIDPPELEKGLYIEPRLAEKIRRLLKEEIEYAERINNH